MTASPAPSATLPGLLISDWDERQGPQVTAALLPGVEEDPDLLATQAFMTSQNVFNSVEFTRVSFSLPNLKIQRKVKYLFDVVPDTGVRGGHRPFVLAIFLPLDVPATLVAELDLVLESTLESIKKGEIPALEPLQSQIARALAGEEVGKDSTPEQPTRDANVRLRVHCTMCDADIALQIPRTAFTLHPATPGDLMYAHRHDAKDPATAPHGLKIVVDKEYRLKRVEYMDPDGRRISPFKKTDVEGIVLRTGAWSVEEHDLLLTEMQRGTPNRTLARMLGRSVRDITKYKRDLEKRLLAEFNTKLKQFSEDAKTLEQTDLARARKFWLKIAEYCLEFSKTPGLRWETSKMIEQKTRAIIDRARGLPGSRS